MGVEIGSLGDGRSAAGADYGGFVIAALTESVFQISYSNSRSDYRSRPARLGLLRLRNFP